MTAKATPPSLFCQDFALIPRGAHEGKASVAFTRPVNLLSAASANGAAVPGQSAAHVLVLNLDGQLYVRDLTGTASLQWNGKAVDQASLHHADKVRLGKIEYEVFATRFAPVNGAAVMPAGELVPATGGAGRALRSPVSLVGSSEQAELRVQAENAPEAIAMILRIGAGYWLWNLEPAFPVLVNGEKVVRAALENDDKVTIAGQEFKFRMQAESEPSQPAAQAAAPRPKPTTRKPEAQVKKGSSAPTPKAAAVRPSPAPMPSPTVQPPAAAPLQPVSKAVAPAADRPAAVEPPAAPPPASKVVAAASAPVEPPVLVPPVVANPSSSAIDRKPTDSVLDDDADVFKQWGPLAFAVAAADRPELQAGGSRSGSGAAPAPASPASGGSLVLKLIVTLVVLGILAAGAFFAWKRWMPSR